MRHMPAAMLHGGGGVLLMMTTKFATQEGIKKTQSYKTNAIEAPSLTTISKPKQLSQQTPCSIKKTYTKVSVVLNEKDGPKMTTAQCNQPRRWSWLQCVRDEERTEDHENSARHATNKLK
jgi:hypothetical protein